MKGGSGRAASDIDGEVLAAARALGRLLKALARVFPVGSRLR
jgi:hypothetical protein